MVSASERAASESPDSAAATSTLPAAMTMEAEFFAASSGTETSSEPVVVDKVVVDDVVVEKFEKVGVSAVFFARVPTTEFDYCHSAHKKCLSPDSGSQDDFRYRHSTHNSEHCAAAAAAVAAERWRPAASSSAGS